MKWGDTIEWFSASFPGAVSEETVDGVHFVREGRQWTVHLSAIRRYRGRLSKNFDIVIDEVNTIPFFTPLWADVPSVMFIHQLAREVWWYESPFPLSAVGYLAEPLYLRCYRSSPVLTVSESTRMDLRCLGFVGDIAVIPEGIESTASQRPSKAERPTFLYVGRLSPSKRVADVIRAFATFCESVPLGELHLIGGGSDGYVHKLHRLVRDLGLDQQVRFLGRVAQGEKDREMARAHVIVLASVREGWGLVVTEANFHGTPAIAYDVPGLRDSIRHEETGLLVEPSTKALGAGMVNLWRNQSLYRRLAAAAQLGSRAFSFDQAATDFRKELEHVLTFAPTTTRGNVPSEQ